MTFTRSAEQRQFASSLHDLLAAADVPGAARRWAGGDHSPGLALWRKLAGLGVTALAVRPRSGGLGASWLDVVIACEELGHHAMPGPVAGAVAQAREAGTLACAAQLLGAGRALLEAGVSHARQRSQFGRPIGSFQAVKHRLADVAIGLEFARPLLDEAAVTLTPRDVSAAKVACTGAAQIAARAALQVHGAIGYTQEHDLHLWLTKVRALAGTWGSQAEHRARVMAAIADGSLAWS